METQIQLYRSNWHTSDGLSVVGWCEWYGEVYEGESLLHLLHDLIQGRGMELYTLSELVKHLNGTFAVVLRQKDALFLIADPVRSYPLLYSYSGDRWIITDDVFRCARELNMEMSLDPSASEFYLAAGLTLGSQTFLKNWSALQAAEIVQLQNKTHKSTRYFIYQLNRSEDKKLHLEEEVRKQNHMYESAFERMIDSVPRVHNWIIPLSGGHDSRLVLYRLYKAGIKNVLCYTYGIPEQREVRISRHLARKLGYPWYFVEYTREKWEQLRSSKEFNAYFDFACNGVSDPHLQDFLAVSELKSKQILQENDVFVPGHTFDFLTGAYCWEGINELHSFEDVYQYLRNYVDQWPYKVRSENIKSALKCLWEESGRPLDQFPEYFFWQERHAKFIQNSLRVYEFFGYEWRTPLWDREILDYWQSIPLSYKMNRNFLFTCEKKGLYQDEIRSVVYHQETNTLPDWKKKLLASFSESTVRKIKFYLKKENPRVSALSRIYQKGHPRIKDIIPYRRLPAELQYYLRPYVRRPLYKCPDNDVNSLYALRNLLDTSGKK